jgi:GAF domain/HlyD family secretion protein
MTPSTAANGAPVPLVVSIGIVRDVDDEWTDVRMISAQAEEEMVDHLSRGPVSILVFGPLLPVSEAHRILHRCSIEFGGRCPRCIVSGVGTHTTLFQDGIDDDVVYYLSRGPLSRSELRALIRGALGMTALPRHQLAGAFGPGPDVLLELLRRLSLQTNLSDVTAVATEVVTRYITASDVQWLLYDGAAHTLWMGEDGGATDRVESAAAGLVGYVARTGQRVVIARPESDSRYDSEADNPAQIGVLHFLAHPVHGTDGTVAAVIAVSRTEDLAFTPSDLLVLEQIVSAMTPTLCGLLLERSLQARVSTAVAPDDDIYRREAVEHHRRGLVFEGRLLTTSPGWLRLGPAWLVAVAAILFAFISLVRIPEYASGTGVIRPRIEVAVSAPVAGRLDAVEARSGQHVEAGALLGRLVRLSDKGEEPLWAPARGVVTSLDIRTGQLVAAGDRLASVVDESAGYELVAFVPASYESQIAPGMSMFFRINGYSDAAQTASIEAVGPILLNRVEAAHIGGDFVTIPGPVVVVRSRLKEMLLSVSGSKVRYRQGMTGDVDVRIGSTPMLASVVAPLRDVVVSQ